jgi:hypothetical protein
VFPLQLVKESHGFCMVSRCGRLKREPPPLLTIGAANRLIWKILAFCFQARLRCDYYLDRRHSEFTEEILMPLIQVKVIEGVFTDAQKRDIVKKLTDAMVSIVRREHAPGDLGGR